MKTIELGVVFGVGAVTYTLIEIIWRGYTHWSMTLTGGVCLVLLYMLNGVMRGIPLAVKCLAGALVITAVEFVVGCIVNLWLHRNVWDYSALRFNLLGQISLTFSFMWMLLSIPAFYLCDVIKKILY